MPGREFEDRVVVVTGVGRAGQAGEAVARAFGEAGAIVYCLSRGAEVRDRAAELRARGIRATAHQIDLTDFAAAAATAATIAASHSGRIDATVALAGGFAASGPIAESDPHVYVQQVAINLTTAYSTARAFLPPVRAARGALVFAASAAALPGARSARLSAYAAAKAGVVQLVRTLADEERTSGVRVNAVAPTRLRTEANVASISGQTRYIELDEFSRVVLALCGVAGARVTGNVVELS